MERPTTKKWFMHETTMCDPVGTVVRRYSRRGGAQRSHSRLVMPCHEGLADNILEQYHMTDTEASSTVSYERIVLHYMSGEGVSVMVPL